MIQVIYNEIEDLLDNWPEKVSNQFLIYFKIIEEKGPSLRAKWLNNFKGEPNLNELKYRHKDIFYRIFYCFFSHDAYMLYGFKKKTDNTPKAEIERAKVVREKLKKQLGA